MACHEGQFNEQKQRTKSGAETAHASVGEVRRCFKQHMISLNTNTRHSPWAAADVVLQQRRAEEEQRVDAEAQRQAVVGLDAVCESKVFSSHYGAQV